MLIKNMSFKELPLMEPKEGTVLFYPYISKSSFSRVKKVLSGRWIGQGPLVDKFENKFKNMFAGKNHCISTGSGTDALHLAYILAGLKKGDEVIAPVYTCTATNIPFLYMGVKIKFAEFNSDGEVTVKDLGSAFWNDESVFKLIDNLIGKNEI